MNEKSEPTRVKRKRLLIVMAILILAVGMILAVVWFVDPSYTWRETISMAQLRKISTAVTAYTKAHDQRPAHLETLVEVGALTAGDLFDAKRDEIPGIDPATGRFDTNPDVIYFPALRKDDPADLVLLCTLLTHKRHDKLLVAYNDGELAELTPHEMIMAMNRTYRFIGEDITDAQSTAAPATRQGN